MNEIICTSQRQFNEISSDYDGRIIIEFGTRQSPAVINRRFKLPVEAWGNSHVEVRENCCVEVWGDCTVSRIDA